MLMDIYMRALIIKVVEIDAICDIKEETADSAVPEFGGKKYASYQQMLEREELDAVHVAVPTFAHYDAEVLAAQKGIHLFLEKPIAPTMEKTLGILETIRQANIISCVGYQIRYTGHISSKLSRFYKVELSGWRLYTAGEGYQTRPGGG
jgi:predicted dehydrogenase